MQTICPLSKSAPPGSRLMQISVYRSQNGVRWGRKHLIGINTDLHGFVTTGALLESGQLSFSQLNRSKMHSVNNIIYYYYFI